MLVAVAMAGCGGGGEGGRDEPAADAGGEYAQQAQRACAAADKAFAAIGPASGAPAVAKARSAWSEAMGDLAAVETPGPQREAHERILGSARDLKRRLERLRTLLPHRNRAKKLHAGALRARSAADSLRTAAQVAKVKGCGDEAVGAADRLLTRPYAALAGHFIGSYRRIIDREAHGFAPASPAAMDQALNAVLDAPLVFDRGLGVLEPPSRLRREHRRAIAAVNRAGAVTVSLYDEKSVSPERLRRVLRRYSAREGRVRRAQNELIAAIRHSMR